MGSSEGIQLEYIAIFLAVLFPGALVAFNYELLQAKPRATALRVYCAGIWHNAVCCAACGLALLMLPTVLSPLYIHGEGPLVLDVPSSSPLSGYLSPGDVIMSLNGIKIRNSQEWMEVAILLEKQTLAGTELMKGFLSVNRGMIYCASSSLVQKSERISFMMNQTSCPREHIAFVSVRCSDSSVDFAGSGEYDFQKISDHGYCLSYADVAKLKNCASLGTSTDGRSNCICSENEQCASPVQMPGITWAEIAYRRPYSHQCMKLEKNMTEPAENSDSGEGCHKTFLYMGDVISMARSVRLTSFQPRFSSMFGAYVPDIFEKIFACTFQVSVALALLNSLPVYFLDGESILEVCSCYITCLSPGKRRLCLQACLFGGSIISCLVFLKFVLIRLWRDELLVLRGMNSSYGEMPL